VRLDDITIDGPYDVRAHAQGAAAAKRAEIKKAGFPYKGRLTVYGTDARAYGTGEDVLEVTEAVHPVRMEPLETVWANESGRHALPLETAWEAYERNKALMLKAFEGGALASDASDFQAAFAASRRLQREYTDPGDPYKGSETEPLVPSPRSSRLWASRSSASAVAPTGTPRPGAATWTSPGPPGWRR
jgi:hypothetical protein